MLRFSFAAACLAASVTATIHPGKCPTYDRPASFDVAGYSGTWYEVRKDKLNFFDLGASCTTANYGLNDDGSVTVYNRAHNIGGYSDITGKAVESQVSGPGSLVVDFFAEPDATKPGNYNVIDTDYKTYSLFYSCNEETKFGVSVRNESFAILARTKSLSDDLLAELAEKTKAILPSYDYDSNVVDTKQEGDCEYSPEPSTQFLQ
eukprot:Macronucleus_3879.p1 GENE.Macronucleus_3879~~Macronucleus_3879.p1  ORF type:complete len:205 (+),score=90.89 Macronucleus_3879:1-615(+)